MVDGRDHRSTRITFRYVRLADRFTILQKTETERTTELNEAEKWRAGELWVAGCRILLSQLSTTSPEGVDVIFVSICINHVAGTMLVAAQIIKWLAG